LPDYFAQKKTRLLDNNIYCARPAQFSQLINNKYTYQFHIWRQCRP